MWMPIPTNMMNALIACSIAAALRVVDENAGAKEGCHMRTPVVSSTAMTTTIDQYMSFWPPLYLPVSGGVSYRLFMYWKACLVHFQSVGVITLSRQSWAAYG